MSFWHSLFFFYFLLLLSSKNVTAPVN
jgi:hypothetical protein